MASPFPVRHEPSGVRKVRPGSELVDYRKDSPDGKILPKKGERNVLVTSALPYVNNQPHLGNIIGSTLSADVFARYARQRNDRTLYICGTDEYGTTTEVMAAKEGVSPQALCDKYHKLHADAYTWFEIGFDHFGRTSTPQQTVIAQDIFLKLYQNGWLEERENEQLYCEKDQRFLADRYVEGTCPKCGYEGARGDQCENCSSTYESPRELVNPKCSACGSTPAARKTAHLYLKLKDLQPQIEEWVGKTSSKGTWSANGKAFTDGWLRGGLESRGMTRDLVWGVKLPTELGEKWANKVMYVWFDAPIGYPSITANYTDAWKEWWWAPDDVTLFQFMGKDNVPFHTVLFPAYLIGTKDPWTMLNSISTTDYLQYEGTKFSKSKNVGVFGSNARETGVPASVWRYYLLSIRPETSDSEFTWDDFVAKSNAELLNNIGNFVNRILKFVVAKFDSRLPATTASETSKKDLTKEAYEFASEDAQFVSDVQSILSTYIDNMDHQKIRSGLQNVMQLSSRGNLFIQENKLDNALLAAAPARAAEVVLLAVNLVYLLGSMVHPFMPSTSDAINAQLNAPPRSIPNAFAIDLLPGHEIGKPAHLFTRIDPKNIEVWRKQFGGGASAAGGTGGEPEKLSKKQLAKMAKEAQKAAAARPRTDEQRALEGRIKEQGEVVRKLKQSTDESDKEAFESELGKLQDMKKELKQLDEQMAGVTI